MNRFPAPKQPLQGSSALLDVSSRSKPQTYGDRLGRQFNEMLNNSVQQQQQIRLTKRQPVKEVTPTREEAKKQRTVTPTSASTFEEVKEPLLPKKTTKIEKSKFPSIIEESLISSKSLNSSRQSSQPVP